MTNGFVGKTALVTGAGRGIGAAIARALADAGANVILLARSADQLHETADAIRANVPRVEVRIVSADLIDEVQRSKVIDDLLAGVRSMFLSTIRPLSNPLGLAPRSPRNRYGKLLRPM